MRFVEGKLDVVVDPRLDAGLDDEAVDDDVDVVADVLVEFGNFFDEIVFPVDSKARESAAAKTLDGVFVRSLLVFDDRGTQDELAAFGVGKDGLAHFHRGRRGNRDMVMRAVRHPDPREEKPKEIVDLGNRPDGGTRVVRGRLLVDRDGGRKPLDAIDVRLVDPAEELPGIGGKAFHVTALPFRVNGIEGQGRLPRARKPSEDRKSILRDRKGDVLEIVFPRSLDHDIALGVSLIHTRRL